MKTMTLQVIKTTILAYQNCLAKTHNAELASNIWFKNDMQALKEPNENTFGGKLYKEFSTNRMYCTMSEKQAFWVALEFCAENNIDMELVKKYKKN